MPTTALYHQCTNEYVPTKARITFYTTPEYNTETSPCQHVFPMPYFSPMEPFIFTATVLPGHGEGKHLGAPTANFDLNLAKNLAHGLYTCTATVDGTIFKALLYYGINSLTSQDCLEAHLLDFNGNLYDKKITVRVGQLLRGEKIFTTKEELREQISLDIQAAQKLFSTQKN